MAILKSSSRPQDWAEMFLVGESEPGYMFCWLALLQKSGNEGGGNGRPTWPLLNLNEE